MIFGQAGITDAIDSKQFLICLEPEAASIYCRQLETDQFATGQDEDTKLLRKTGQKYMIVDAGGKKKIDMLFNQI